MNQTSLQIGALLRGGTYRIDRVLGQGGFGITYLATDLSLDKHVAIKEFFPKDYCDRNATTSHVTLGTQSTSEFVERLKAKFLKEAKNIAKFDHPNIIKIHAAFEENNTAYYVMDFIEGESLSDRVKRQGALPRAEALEYIYKVGQALGYVHSFRMNHLDVKPANIMVRTGDNCPILIDFGLSKQYDAKGHQTSTTPVGISHGYAPMEQYNDGGVREFSPTTDEYSLAATLYYLLSGVTPPQATKLIEDELTFPQSIPMDLIPPISKAMSSSRKNRYQTVNLFLGDINASTTHTEETEIPKHVKPKTQQSKNETTASKPKPSSTTKWLSAIGVAIILVAFNLWRGCGNETTGEHDPIANGSVDSDCVDTDNSSEPTKTDTQKPPARQQPQQQSSNNQLHSNLSANSATETGNRPSARPTTGSINGHDYVDLGLSVKWATCNVGATSPSDYGSYFAWGETNTKSEYTKANSITHQKDMGDIAGNPQYDAARANWGSTWRLPTEAECKELVNKCTWTWTTQGGHNGYRVTSKTNGNSIFVPAASCRNETSLDYVGECGHYYSSSPSESDIDYAYRLYFDSSRHDVGWYYRYYGRSVRPVSE